MGLHLEPDARYLPWLWEARRAGAERVSLVVLWEQHDVRSTAIGRTSRSAPDDDVRQAIRDAHAVGLEVLLFPMVGLQSAGAGEWRGRLAPLSVNAWFDAYRDFVLHYARIAESEGVSELSIGSELGSMEQYDIAWRELIAAVRIAYGGRLLYSANWDHYVYTPFWDALDRIGLTGYFEMPGVSDAAGAQAAWEVTLDDIGAFAAEWQRPVVLTEVGYTSQDGSASRPWDYTANAPLDLATQAGLYDGAWQAFCGADWLDSAYIWNWFGAGGPRDNGYTPRNKPAEQVLRGGSTPGNGEVE